MLTVHRSVKMLRHCLVPVASGKNPGLFIGLLVQDEPGVYVHMLMCIHVCACACVYAYIAYIYACMCVFVCECLYVLIVNVCPVCMCVTIWMHLLFENACVQCVHMCVHKYVCVFIGSVMWATPREVLHQCKETIKVSACG